MTFEDWADIYDCAEENSRMFADWKAEREKLIGAAGALVDWLNVPGMTNKSRRGRVPNRLLDHLETVLAEVKK